MKKIAVIGAGTMGNGIAHVFSQSGFQVTLIDISSKSLEKGIATIKKNLDRMIKKQKINENQKKATLDRISISISTEEGVKDADVVIEAVTENIDLKLEIFKEIDTATNENTILASNTSSISITKIASVTSKPENVIGMHFMNPVPVMKLVEIISGYLTSEKTIKQVKELSIQLSKVPVVVNDYPGFVANKILMPMINEAIITLHEGTAGVSEIDTVMKLGMAHPMGPLHLADFIGLDVCMSILEVLQKGYGNPKYAPCSLLVNMVTAGKLGVKSGEGFYSWQHGTKELIVANAFS